MATFSTYFDDRVQVDIHRIPLSEMVEFESLGNVSFLDNYPKEGQRLRMLEIRIGSVMIVMYTNVDEYEEMPNEP